MCTQSFPHAYSITHIYEHCGLGVLLVFRAKHQKNNLSLTNISAPVLVGDTPKDL